MLGYYQAVFLQELLMSIYGKLLRVMVLALFM